MISQSINTPRTDSAHNSDKYEEYTYDAVLTCSRQLERELAEAKAEVERLREALQSCYWETNSNYDNVARIAIAALKTQNK